MIRRDTIEAFGRRYDSGREDVDADSGGVPGAQRRRRVDSPVRLPRSLPESIDEILG